ncbi:MAG: hypothetical protein JRJ04_05500 [Deltaproteobacteria bacterium]|nr:hypothetical protein [Deltaproteobacteria bacterium]
MLGEAGQDIQSINTMDEDDTDGQKAVLKQAEKKISALKPLADLYTAYLMDSTIQPVDYNTLFYNLAKQQPVDNPLLSDLPEILDKVESFTERHRFFHWPLEFPDVFGSENSSFVIRNSQLNCGFSTTVGNPPWDIVKPNSQEFFSAYDPKFRSYKKQEANRVSKKLMADNPAIAKRWKEYCDGFAKQSTYFKEPLSYTALGKGDINTFKLFLEQFFTVLADGGRMGIVVPSGIYTDQGCQPLREMFFNQSRIEFLYGFENRRAVFNIHRSFKFVLFGTQKGGKTDRFKCAFMEHDPERLPAIDANALKISVKQVKKFSPDTLSVMEFKSQQDIDVTAKIYGDWPLLGEKLEDTWNVKFRSELHMTNDSHLFKTTPTDCLLYEGKMIWLFDSAFEQPRYWLDRDEVEEALGENAWEGRHYRVGFRDVAASTNERTLIASIVPPYWIGNTLPTVIPKDTGKGSNGPNDLEGIWLATFLGSFCADFVIRQKITNHMNFFYMKTIPVPRETESAILKSFPVVIAKSMRLICVKDEFKKLWENIFSSDWQSPEFWYPPSAPIDNYGPAHEQEIRRRLRDEARNLTPEWGPHCGVHDRLPDRRDIGDRAQLRAEIDAYVAHLYGLSRDDFAYILDTFPVLKKKEEKAFGEFMSKRKCLEEYDRICKLGITNYE